MTNPSTNRPQATIVLTGSVIQSYRRLENDGLQNPKERLKDSICAIDSWINQPEIEQVIYCDSSGFHIPEYVFDRNRFHSYSLDLRSVALNQGKGPAESQTMEYLLKYCRTLPENFFKCTGRLFVKNFSALFKEIEQNNSLFSIRLNHDTLEADTRFYWFQRQYYLQQIQPHQHENHDYGGTNIEHVYYRYCQECPSFSEPVLVGRSGHTGRYYAEDYPDEIKNKAASIINKFRLMR